MRGFATKSKGTSARACEKISETHKDVDRAANRYRRARLALIALGKSPDDPVYRPLCASDKKAFHVGTNKETLGSSRTVTSWIWDNLSFAGDNAGEGFEEFFSEGESDRGSPMTVF